MLWLSDAPILNTSVESLYVIFWLNIIYARFTQSVSLNIIEYSIHLQTHIFYIMKTADGIAFSLEKGIQNVTAESYVCEVNQATPTGSTEYNSQYITLTPVGGSISNV